MQFSFVLMFISIQISIVYSMNFCDNKTEVLVDSIFQFKNTVYVYRGPNAVFILERDANGIWSQVVDALPLLRLFRGFQRTSFDSAFSVFDFEKCDTVSNKKCRYENPEFEATNITFVFYRREFFIYQRKGEEVFEPIDWGLKNAIPWNANTQGSTAIFDLFSGLRSRLDGAVYFMPNGKDSPVRHVLILSNNHLYDYELNDGISAISLDVKLNSSPTESNPGSGGFMDMDGNVIFVVQDNLYKVSRPTGYMTLQDMHTTTWDYFNCNTMKPFVPTTEVPPITTNINIDKRDSDSLEPDFQPPRPPGPPGPTPTGMPPLPPWPPGPTPTGIPPWPPGPTPTGMPPLPPWPPVSTSTEISHPSEEPQTEPVTNPFTEPSTEKPTEPPVDPSTQPDSPATDNNPFPSDPPEDKPKDPKSETDDRNSLFTILAVIFILVSLTMISVSILSCLCFKILV